MNFFEQVASDPTFAMPPRTRASRIQDAPVVDEVERALFADTDPYVCLCDTEMVGSKCPAMCPADMPYVATRRLKKAA